MVDLQPYTCEGPDDLGAQWPSQDELYTFGDTIDGMAFDVI